MSETKARHQAWIAINRAQKRLSDTIEGALKAAGLPLLSWYDVLWELEKAPDCCLRPVELEARLLMPQHNLSRLLTRMAAAGLVDKTRCPDDGRGQRVVLTDNGRRTRARMWTVYGPALDDALGKLNEADAGELVRKLDRI